MSCPVCDARGGAQSLRVPGFPDGAERELRRCAPCGLWYAPDYRPPDYRARPLSHWGFGRQHAQVAGFQYHLGLIHRHRLPPGRYLDVGAGPGYAAMNAWCNGWDARGMEICEELVAWGDRYLQVPMTAAMPAGGEVYDVISSTEVIEHVPRPLPFLERLFELQAPGGILFLTTPNGECRPARERPREWEPMRNGQHCVLWGMAGLQRLLSRTGWEILEDFAACGPDDDEQLHVVARKPGVCRAREVPRSWLETLGVAADPRRAVRLTDYIGAGTSPLARLERRLDELEGRLERGPLETRGLVVRGRDGGLRAALCEDEQGSLQLQLLDAGGRPRLRLALLDDGAPMLALMDDRGVARTGAILDGSGRPHLGLYDGDQRIRAMLAIGDDDRPRLTLAEPDGAAGERS